MGIGLGAALAAAVLFGAGAVVQAVAVRRHGLVSPMMGLVAAVYVLGWLLHLVAIARTPLFLAQVGTALSLAVTVLIAAVVIGEPLERRHWIALTAQVGGLALLAVSAGAVGRSEFEPRDTVVLYLGLLLVLLVAAATVRLPRHRGGVLLGTLAGLAYAGSPIASRALVDPALDLATALPALAVGLYGLVGFWLYSTALARTSVTAVTAPAILLQTLVPSLVGVLAFADGVRDGWWPGAVAGLVVSTLGALALVDAETRLEHLEGMVGDPMVGWVHDDR